MYSSLTHSLHTHRAIGEHVAALVDNGATLQMGIGSIANAALQVRVSLLITLRFFKSLSHVVIVFTLSLLTLTLWRARSVAFIMLTLSLFHISTVSLSRHASVTLCRD